MRCSSSSSWPAPWRNAIGRRPRPLSGPSGKFLRPTGAWRGRPAARHGGVGGGAVPPSADAPQGQASAQPTETALSTEAAEPTVAAPTVPAEQTAPTEQTAPAAEGLTANVVVIAPDANFRAEPSSASESLAVLAEGTELTTLGETVPAEDGRRLGRPDQVVVHGNTSPDAVDAVAGRHSSNASRTRPCGIFRWPGYGVGPIDSARSVP